MKCVIKTDKKKRQRRVTLGAAIGIILIILCAGCIRLKRKTNVQISENDPIKSMRETLLVPYQYIEFEKLFREHKEDMQAFIELSRESISGEQQYLILFDEDWYSSMQSGHHKEWINILYNNNTFISEKDEEIAETLNKNDDLIKTLDSIKEKGVIIEIGSFCLTDSIQMVEFVIDPKFTPFITTNNGVTNWFGYCTDEECERYGYKNVEDNWYMFISPAPE